MDAKTAVGILCDYSHGTLFNLGSDNAIAITKLIEQQEKYAELGRLITTQIDNSTCEGEMTKSCKYCSLKFICQKRAELLTVLLPKQKEKCAACNGSGHYDNHGSPKCECCNGTGYGD